MLGIGEKATEIDTSAIFKVMNVTFVTFWLTYGITWYLLKTFRSNKNYHSLTSE
jgi:hypothetical protein